MRIDIRVDNLLELVGVGLAIWALYLIAGRGAAVLTAAVCAVVLAEFSFSDHVWHLSTPQMRRPHPIRWLRGRLRRRSEA